jgi:predicted esterase
MHAIFAFTLLLISLNTRTMERLAPRWFCHEGVAHAQMVNALTLPLSLSAALGAHLYDSSSSVSTILAAEASLHSLFAGALWAMGKLGRTAAFAHDSEKYEKRSKKSKAALGHHNKNPETDYTKNDLAATDESFGLVPNDISQWSSQGTWIRHCSKHLNQSIAQEIDPHPEAFVRKEYLFEPEKISSKQPLVIVVTHGTFGSQTASYYKDYSQLPLSTNISPQNYRHIERFATRLGNEKQQHVALLSFRWSGDLDNGDRIIAGKILAAILNKNYQNATTILIGHSHGCNVHRHAAQLLNNDVSLMIHFAPPYRSEKEYAPTGRIVRSFSFASPHDLIARGGQVPERILSPIGPAIETTALAAIGWAIPQTQTACITTGALIWAAHYITALPYVLKNSLSGPQEGRLLDVRILPTINGASLGHSEMANMSRYLWPLWCTLADKKGLQAMHASIKTNPASIHLEQIPHP